MQVLYDDYCDNFGHFLEKISENKNTQKWVDFLDHMCCSDSYEVYFTQTGLPKTNNFINLMTEIISRVLKTVNFIDVSIQQKMAEYIDYCDVVDVIITLFIPGILQDKRDSIQ